VVRVIAPQQEVFKAQIRIFLQNLLVCSN